MSDNNRRSARIRGEQPENSGLPTLPQRAAKRRATTPDESTDPDASTDSDHPSTSTFVQDRVRSIEIEDLRRQIEDLKEQLTRMPAAHASHVAEITREKEVLETARASLQMHVDEMRTKLAAYESGSAVATNDLLAQRQIVGLKCFLERARTDMFAFKRQAADLQRKIDELDARERDMRAEACRMQTENEQLRAHVAHLSTRTAEPVAFTEEDARIWRARYETTIAASHPEEDLTVDDLLARLALVDLHYSIRDRSISDASCKTALRTGRLFEKS
jgi:chromosome segregation ATPase